LELLERLGVAGELAVSGMSGLRNIENNLAFDNQMVMCLSGI
jgi:hypothetical protein